MLTSQLTSMVKRDLLDFENEFTSDFLALKIADVSAELFLSLPGYTLTETAAGWEITPDPPYSIQRLISLLTSIEIILFQVATIKKISEEIREPGLSYAYKSSALSLKIALEELIKKRDRLLTLLRSSNLITSSVYAELISRFRTEE